MKHVERQAEQLEKNTEHGEAWELKHGRTGEARPFLSPSEKVMELAVQLEKQRVRQTDLENIKDENKEDR